MCIRDRLGGFQNTTRRVATSGASGANERPSRPSAGTRKSGVAGPGSPRGTNADEVAPASPRNVSHLRSSPSMGTGRGYDRRRLRTDDFDYELPKDLIAQEPPARRE